MLKKFFALILTIALAASNMTVTFANDDSEQTTRPEEPVDVDNYGVVTCGGNYRSIVKLSNQNAMVWARTGRIFVPYSTATVNDTYSVQVSNQATISLIPEFLNWGYSVSYTAGNSIGWMKYNDSPYNKELVVKAFYDTFRVVSYEETYPGSGACNVYTTYQTLYRGWGWDIE